MNALSIETKNVDAAGEPYVACQNLTKSAAESNRTADAAECVATALGTFILDVDKDLKSTIHRPVLSCLLPWNTVLLAVSTPVTKSAQHVTRSPTLTNCEIDSSDPLSCGKM
jgi:hypothetical protein